MKEINFTRMQQLAGLITEAENTPAYYAIFNFHGEQPYYMTSRSAIEMVSRLNGYLKSIGDNYTYEISDLQDDYYNGTLLPSVVSDDFTLITKNPEFFKKNLTYYPNAIEYKGLNTSEAVDAPSGETSNSGPVQGNINLALYKQLAPNLNPQDIVNTLNKVKSKANLIVKDNQILAALMIALINTSDDTLLNKIAANLKQTKAE